MPTFYSLHYFLVLVTSLPELPQNKWCPSNPVVSPDQQCSSNIHLATDWYPSDGCLPDHLPLCTIPKPSLIWHTSVHILLAMTDAHWGIPSTEYTIAGIILCLYGWRVLQYAFALYEHNKAIVTTLKGGWWWCGRGLCAWQSFVWR